MGIKRSDSPQRAAVFSVNVNVVLKGSKKMTPEQQEGLMAVDRVRILIVDAEDPDNELVNEVVDAHEFSTGSVGYGLSLGEAQFRK
jgi:hypothetical protein